MESASSLDTTPVPDSSVPKLLARVAGLAALGDKYRGLLDARGPIALSDLPILTKDDFRSALDDVLRSARSRRHGALIYGSGGTTSAPKLSLIPSGMFVTDILAHWRPLAADDVLVNLDTPGRLCSSHNFFNLLAHESGAVVAPLGSIDDEMEPWLEFVERIGATALNATQSHIAHILQYCESSGRRVPAFRKLLWTGEAYSDRAAELTRRLLPDAELHGVYGSTETWVIGYNGPGCRLDTFHLLPYQHVEIHRGLVLVTNTHPRCINPVLRYRIGDRGEYVTCTCGRQEPALRVLGRDDPQVKFLSILVAPEEIVGVARAVRGVRDVQLALFEHGRPGESMELRLLVEPEAMAQDVACRTRESVLTKVYRLGFEVAMAPEAFRVRVVDRLDVNRRSGKTPLLVKVGGD
jgi:phenylacetate-coenzyme A ligase PaaK-like adenylate-forming protein